MAESSDVQTLEKISTEVDESQFKIILSSHCIKAQAFLVDKLRKQSEQQKQICNFISNGNLKLETEIKLAEQEVKSLLHALDTIKTANVELKKETLLGKERKLTVNERVNNGIKKYEELWVVSKRRYESIPFIQNYLQIRNENNIIHDNIIQLNDEVHKIKNTFNIRQIELLNLDRKSVIEVAKFMVHERPRLLKAIQDKYNEIKELSNDIQKLTKEHSSVMEFSKNFITCSNEEQNKIEPMDVLTENTWPSLSTDTENTIMMPRLQIRNVDLDSLTIKLDQMKKVDSKNNSKYSAENIVTIERIPTRSIKSDEMIKDLFVSSYFQTSKQIIEDKDVTVCETKKYSEKKLINILEDIKLDKMETYNIVSNIKPSCLKDVNIIKAEVSEQQINSSQEKANKPLQDEVIEVIDMTKQSQNILVPPTQFLDLTQELVNSQNKNDQQADNKNLKNSSQERRVTFDEIISVRDSDTEAIKGSQEEILISDGPNNQLNVSAKSDDSYTKLKESVFKKHKLDLSPQFSYTKNKPMKSTTNVITSKFFFENNNDDIDKTTQVMEIDDSIPLETINNQKMEEQDPSLKNNNNVQDIIELQKPVAGFLFSHGPQGIPDSLNVSISTTVYDKDADYPQCIDSSLLLSPKADIEMPSTSSNNVQVLSQEVPNFLSGIKKSGFSFFGNKSSENKPDGNGGVQNNNFTFSFGGDEKKNRGGLFNIFR